MNKITEIKAAQLTARKNRDSVRAILLTTVIGEAEMIGKSDGNRESTDAEVVQVLKRFEKNMLENLKIFIERGISVFDVGMELAIVREFLPLKLTDPQVLTDIESIMIAMNLPKEQRSMGVITKELKVRYGDQFDGKQVSSLFKWHMNSFGIQL